MHSNLDSLPLGTIFMGLFGGLALFLYGMEQMTDALKMVAGQGMKKLLHKLTTNRFKAAFAGALVTAVIQSSSVTTVLVVGFISAGLLSLSQSIGIIMGANIGTTITAQIIAFKVTHYALILVAIGFAMLFFFKNEKVQHYGHMLMGLGLIFFGMQMMSDATKPLRSFQPFIELMQKMDNPVMGILVSAAFTGLIQSSSATTGVIIVLASQNFITLEAGIALVFGANVGTCVTAMLASIGKPKEAKQAALAHVVFNAMGVIIWIAFIGHLADVVRWLSPVAADLPRQIANAHTVFNVTNTLLFIAFTTQMAALVKKIIPDREVKDEEEAAPQYLNEIILQTPSLALDLVRMELGRLGAATLRMVKGCMHPILAGYDEELRELAEMDDRVDALHAALIVYLGRLSRESLSSSQTQVLHAYMSAANYFENIGDMIESNLVEAGQERLEKDLTISSATQEILQSLHDRVTWSVEHSVQALVAGDADAAREIMDAKDDINLLADEAEGHLARRLTAEEPNRIYVFRIESEMIEYLKRVYYFAKRIAKLVDTNMQLSEETGDTVNKAGVDLVETEA
jgi:phosphate:Na+ symporter